MACRLFTSRGRPGALMRVKFRVNTVFHTFSHLSGVFNVVGCVILQIFSNPEKSLRGNRTVHLLTKYCASFSRKLKKKTKLLITKMTDVCTCMEACKQVNLCTFTTSFSYVTKERTFTRILSGPLVVLYLIAQLVNTSNVSFSERHEHLQMSGLRCWTLSCCSLHQSFSPPIDLKCASRPTMDPDGGRIRPAVGGSALRDPSGFVTVGKPFWKSACCATSKQWEPACKLLRFIAPVPSIPSSLCRSAAMLLWAFVRRAAGGSWRRFFSHHFGLF